MAASRPRPAPVTAPAHPHQHRMAARRPAERIQPWTPEYGATRRRNRRPSLRANSATARLLATVIVRPRRELESSGTPPGRAPLGTSYYLGVVFRAPRASGGRWSESALARGGAVMTSLAQAHDQLGAASAVGLCRLSGQSSDQHAGDAAAGPVVPGRDDEAKRRAAVDLRAARAHRESQRRLRVGRGQQRRPGDLPG